MGEKKKGGGGGVNPIFVIIYGPVRCSMPKKTPPGKIVLVEKLRFQIIFP